MPLIYMYDDLETGSEVASGLDLVLNHGKSIEEAAEFVEMRCHDLDNALYDKIDSLHQDVAKRALYRLLSGR